MDESSVNSEYSVTSKRSKSLKNPVERKAKKQARLEAFRKRREAKGKKVKTVSFAKQDMVRVHPIATYKRWNHR